MTIRGILFDKDGTLTDFHATWVPAYLAAAGRISESAQYDGLVDELMAAGGFERVTGRCEPSSVLACGSTTEIATLWARLANTDGGEVLAILERVFAHYAADQAVPSTNLISVFSSLKSYGLQLGVATMDSEALAHQLLANFELQQYFSFVCGYDSGFGEKPAPGMVHAFCDATGLPPVEVAVVGDTPHDLNMARNAGVGLVVGVLSGASGREALEELADHVLNDIADLDSLLS